MLGATYLVWCAVVTWREVPIWKSSAAVVAVARARAPENYWPPKALAYLARDAGRNESALAQFGIAANLLPLDWEMLTDGASLALARHDTALALPWLRAAIDANPAARRARTRLAAVLLARGKDKDARLVLLEGLRLTPDNATWRAMLAGHTR